MQIVSYGSQDLYLTGTPEITYFKIVYRRHTNFAMETHKIQFDDTVGFGTTNIATVDKIGDLMYDCYLEIEIPEISFKRRIRDDSCEDHKEAINNYELLQSFMSINRQVYVEAKEIFMAENNDATAAADMKNKANDIFNDPMHATTINDFKDLLLNTTLNILFIYEELSIQEIFNNIISNDKDIFFNAMKVGIDKSIKVQKVFFYEMIHKRTICEDSLNDNLKFAWVERLGHAIIEEIEVKIGGQKIDKHLGEWINIWYELTANRDNQVNYFKMIGNVPKLTTFNRKGKPAYKLTVPLQFWFCRHNGLALPLVALEYHDVTFHVKFRNFTDVSFIEDNKTIFISETSENLFLEEVPDELNININAHLLINYIYLDRPERRKFAQSSHEYLIDQLQFLEFRNIKTPHLRCVLNNFVHPCKELVWIAMKERYTQNIDGHTQTRFDNYSVSDENKGNIIIFSNIWFHSYTRVIKLNGDYFNYVQPYEAHSTTPSDGINVYSFAITPEEFQPSGSANLGRLSNILLLLDFDPILFPDDNEPEPLRIIVFARTTNILRFINGMAGAAYTF